MNREQSGFTLIELLIVVAIIGILVAIAAPMYQRNVIRSQIAEGLQLAASAKEAVGDFHMNRGGWPADNAAASLPAPNEIRGGYTLQVSVTNNVITIQYGNNAHSDITNGTVTLTATNNNGSLSWTCASGAIILPDQLPAACR